MIKAIKKALLFIAACVIFVILAIFGAGGTKNVDIAFGKPADGKTVENGSGKNDIVYGTSVFMAMDYDGTEPARTVTYPREDMIGGTEYSSSTADAESVLASVFDEGEQPYDLKDYTFYAVSDSLSESDTAIGACVTEVEVPDALSMVSDDLPYDGYDENAIAYYAPSDNVFEADDIAETDGGSGDMTVQCEFGFAGTDYFTTD